MVRRSLSTACPSCPGKEAVIWMPQARSGDWD
ncbi:MAG: hypothetical protein ACN6PJ_27005 [Achromobacter sp.]